jgi:hypothetical protein
VLKTIDHVPLALFVLLDKHVDKPLPDDVINTLHGLQQLTGAVAFPIGGLSETTTERLVAMMHASENFEQQVLAAGKVSRTQLDAFVESMRAPTMANVDDAVAMELGALNDAVNEFRKQMSPAEWKRVHVVVASGHMPRDHERRMQYFLLLLDQHDEGDRVIYQEGSDDIDKAIDLVATHMLDASIAREYFKGDSWRMHRDLLSDSAAKYLREHPPAR